MSVGQFVSPELVSSVLDRKDNTWLQLDVCPVWRERGSCPSLELCCHAHPPPHIEILESNRVVSCYDEVKKGTCKRKDCKFFHPPNHLKNVVNTNGRNNLRLRNELKAQFRALYGQTSVASRVSGLASLPTYYNYSSYLPVSYLGAPTPAPALEPEEAVSPPGECRRRAFSPERLQAAPKYHPYYVVGGQLDRQAQRRMAPDLATAQLQQPLPASHYYDNLLVPPHALLYSQAQGTQWPIPTLASTRDK